MTFTLAETDQTPLAEAARRVLARRRGVAVEDLAVTFTAIEPANDTARALTRPKGA